MLSGNEGEVQASLVNGIPIVELNKSTFVECFFLDETKINES